MNQQSVRSPISLKKKALMNGHSSGDSLSTYNQMLGNLFSEASKGIQVVRLAATRVVRKHPVYVAAGAGALVVALALFARSRATVNKTTHH